MIKTRKIEIMIFKAMAWCQPCMIYKPILEQFQIDNPTINIINIDVDDNPDKAKEYGVRSVPTTLFLMGGKVIDERVGIQSVADLERVISKYTD